MLLQQQILAARGWRSSGGQILQRDPPFPLHLVDGLARDHVSIFIASDENGDGARSSARPRLHVRRLARRQTTRAHLSRVRVAAGRRRGRLVASLVLYVIIRYLV